MSGPDGSEERKPRMNGRGAKNKKYNKDERSKRKRQNRTWATKENRKEIEQKVGRKWERE